MEKTFSLQEAICFSFELTYYLQGTPGGNHDPLVDHDHDTEHCLACKLHTRQNVLQAVSFLFQEQHQHAATERWCRLVVGPLFAPSSGKRRRCSNLQVLPPDRLP